MINGEGALDKPKQSVPVASNDFDGRGRQPSDRRIRRSGTAVLGKAPGPIWIHERYRVETESH